MAKYTLDAAHSELEFKVRHMMIANVKGTFDSFDIAVNGEDIHTAGITVTIDAASINTNNADRDTHLKSADFFDVENHPQITFVSKSFSGDKLTGDLTIKGITKEITVEVETGGENKDPWGNTKTAFAVNGKLNRKDFGLNWNAALEAGGVMVSDEVKFNAEIQFIKA